MDRRRKSPTYALWLLFSMNVAGLALYLYFASWAWAPPGQEGFGFEAGGDIVIWVLAAFPCLVIWTLINLIVSRSAITRLLLYRDWRLFALWLTIVIAWFGAFEYDSGRHYNGSQLSAQDSGVR